jgi:glycosyltransferase involved in cell wall biosynthesis
MRVALFVHCFFPEHFYGTETYTLDLARNLRALGHEVTVVTAVFPGEAPRSSLVTRYEYEGVPVICIDKNRLPHKRIRDTYFQPEMAGVLTEVVRELAPDVAHVTHLINHTAVLLDVLAGEGVPVVGSFTDFFGFCYNNKLEAADGSLCAGPNVLRSNCIECHLKALDEQGRQDAAAAMRLPGRLKPLSGVYLKLRRAVTGQADGEVAEAVLDISLRPALLRQAYTHYAAGIAATKFLAEAYRRNNVPVPMHRIPFGVDIDRTAKPARPPGSPVTFGFIGQIAPHKGTDLLVEAFTRLPEGRARLLIHGPASQDPRFYEGLVAASAGRSVEFRGTFPPAEMSRKFAEIDVLVIPSRWYENSPLVLLYALATHTPVIVTDVEGLTEFVEEGRSGFAFPKGDVGALSAAMAKFVETPGLLARMSAQTRYEQDSRSMAQAVVSIYESVVNARCAA